MARVGELDAPSEGARTCSAKLNSFRERALHYPRLSRLITKTRPVSSFCLSRFWLAS